MSKLQIKKHNFDLAKKNIEEFSRNLPTKISFDRFKVEGGLFGLGNHKVTGVEMNRFVNDIQSKLISVNSFISSLLKEFREVYKAFDYLDGEYISGIVTSIESATEASQQALNAQDDINQTVDNLKKTVIELVKLKNDVEKINQSVHFLSENIITYDLISSRLDETYQIKQIPSIIDLTFELASKVKSLADTVSITTSDFYKLNDIILHIKNHEPKNNIFEEALTQLGTNTNFKYIDSIKEDLTYQKKDLTNLHQQVDDFIGNIHQVTNLIRKDIDSLQQHRSLVESYVHLGDIDTIWNNVVEQKKDLTDFHQQVYDFIKNVQQITDWLHNDIDSLQQYRSLLESYAHLGDIDTIWNNIIEQKKDLTDFHQQVNDFIKNVYQITDLIHKDIDSLQQYRSLLESYVHLGDIDTIWDDLVEQKKDLTDFHQQVNDFIKNVQQVTDLIHKDIDSFQQYRSLLESYAHLGDIDTIWDDLVEQKKDLMDFHQQVDDFIKNVYQITGWLHSDIESLQQYRSLLESYTHLGDIDTIWGDLTEQKKDLIGFHQQVDDFIKNVQQVTDLIHKDIDSLQQYRSLLESYTHLRDIDTIWNDLTEQKKDLIGFHQQVDDFVLEVHTIESKIEKKILQLEESNISAHLMYEKKIKIAYFIGGGAIAFSLINFILQLLGIL